jgi:hypothetical protein
VAPLLASPAVELCRIAEQIEQMYPGLVQARVVARPDKYIGYRGPLSTSTG